MSELVSIKIDGKPYQFNNGISILNACKLAGIEIPTLCYLEDISEDGSCSLCLVEIKGIKTLQRACLTKITEGMEIKTNSELIYEARKTNLELLLAHHPLDCMTCDKDSDCILQDLAYQFGIKISQFLDKNEAFYTPKETAWDTNSFIQFDPQKCVLCRRCIGACENQSLIEAIGIAMRGYRSTISTPFNIPLEQTNCQFCAECVQACPTGALIEKTRIGKGKIFNLEKTDTVCAYCGVGCNISLYTDKKNKIIMARAVENKEPNKGRLCVKGRYGFEYTNSSERILQPLIKVNGNFREVIWEEALDYTTNKLLEIKEKYGPDAIGVLGSARCTNEDNYLIQKFARAVIGTNNIDHCARLCHSSTVVGLGKALGTGAATNPISDIMNSNVMFVIGSNTTESHPVIAQFIKENKKKRGAKLIVCDPRSTDIARYADIFIQHYPGTDVLLLNAMAKIIIEKDLINKDFIDKYTEGFQELLKTLENCNLDDASKITGVSKSLIEDAAINYAKGPNSIIFYTMGITQHHVGVSNVLSIANLALITGHIGKPGNGINPLRGQANVQGACDVGVLPDVYTGYQKVTDESVRRKFEEHWKVKLPKNIGFAVSQFSDLIFKGKIKALYIMGENPLVTEPDVKHAKESFEKLEFLAVQDIFLSETAQMADVVFPAKAAYEKFGTFTNTERRVQLIKPAKNPSSSVKDDWKIICEIAKRAGYPMDYKGEEEIWEEIRNVTPSLKGISYKRLEENSIQWPCPEEEHPGTQILHLNGNFKRPNKKALISSVTFQPPSEIPDMNFPYILTTGRILYHYHSRNETRRVKVLEEFVPENFVEINPEDAKEIGVKEKDLVKIKTRRGEIVVRAKISAKPKKGVIFLSFHFSETNANILTINALDPEAKIPEYKACACAVEKFMPTLTS
ncbi:formate dehydrogenase, alpha subunit [Thermodesulfobium narugense DSM 14796]|uniref:Formate dehydrogenase, alpha subunit n=1 Tax=Thermodesulfobium narugense DSM 14796 TaxID=747365 RepID=M1E675_9BACT|nr:formate dehydrogenase subunit alpha [Thermodesulfobium narugense]AEE14671.1 formate dehydrogenase, alpha subunit [Thermodesulfobium narugense DSM 14796]